MRVHFVHCEIFDVEHWNITQRCNKSVYFMLSILNHSCGGSHTDHLLHGHSNTIIKRCFVLMKMWVLKSDQCKNNDPSDCLCLINSIGIVDSYVYTSYTQIYKMPLKLIVYRQKHNLISLCYSRERGWVFLKATFLVIEGNN